MFRAKIRRELFVNVEGKNVKHSKYGEGVVAELTETTVVVDFGGAVGVKKFIYPTAFEQFLSLICAEEQQKLKEELRSSREAIAEDFRRREAESEAQREADRQELIAQRHETIRRKVLAARRAAAKKSS